MIQTPIVLGSPVRALSAGSFSRDRAIVPIDEHHMA
jgi:hypothetical protein